MKIMKVGSWDLGVIHAVIEGATITICGIPIPKYWKEYDKPVKCKRCLGHMAQLQRELGGL
jgi:hypothetical protein